MSTNVIQMSDYMPTQQDLFEMDIVLLGTAAMDVANRICAHPELYTKFRNDLLEFSYQAHRMLERIDRCL